MSRPRVCGIDISLTATGVAGDGWTARMGRSGKKGDSVAQSAERIRYTADRVFEHVAGDTVLAVVEGPSFGSTGALAHERGGLYWRIVCGLLGRDIPVAVVAPKTRLVYALGTGDTRGMDTGQIKRCVATAVADWHPGFCGDDNQADAAVLHAMGMAHLGHPVADLPPTHTRALAVPTWPVIIPTW